MVHTYGKAIILLLDNIFIWVLLLLSDLGSSQSQKLAHEMRFSLIFINSSPTPSITDVG